jgi:PHD/YefM family antitoxin component YafN of YafNO toxin-antitoxin module
MQNFNYRDLLKKYIEHVGEEEGITFLGDSRKNSNIFSEEEWEELKELEYESAVDFGHIKDDDEKP